MSSQMMYEKFRRFKNRNSLPAGGALFAYHHTGKASCQRGNSVEQDKKKGGCPS